MTGREIILYILKNNLENDNLIERGDVIKIADENDMAAVFEVGPECIKAWANMNIIPSIECKGKRYFMIKKE